ncbi:MAG: hypothetical protein O7D91_08910 [Planctomycetota bacterium]|nr:hypothetical protein [Planctomycetota bacterium]
MNDRKWAITLATCCSICLTIAASASADFVGVTTVIKDDPDTEFLCTQGNGDFVPGPLTVCNVFAVFDNPNDVLLSVGNADLQVYNGAIPGVFFQHVFNASVIAPMCFFIEFIAPDLICDTFITIGYKCGPDPAGTDATAPGADFDAGEFNLYGHIVGGWFNASPPNGQGVAGTWPDLQVLFLQTSVAQGLSLSGDIDLFWRTDYNGDTYAEVDVPIECAAGCTPGEPCDDGDPCTENDMCGKDGCVNGTPIDCDDDNECTDDDCVDGVCIHTPVPDMTGCDDGDVCTYDDYCDYGVCYGYPQWCTDNNDCTIDYCDPASGCVNEPTDCDDSNPCTDDYCDPDSSQCVNQPLPDGTSCDDGDACSENDQCTKGFCMGPPIDCNDDNECTWDTCDPASGCVYDWVMCPAGEVCDPATGACVEIQDLCECVNGRVTLCHIPQGNRANARTITVGCAARDRHLAHGDVCGPCEDGGG